MFIISLVKRIPSLVRRLMGWGTNRVNFRQHIVAVIAVIFTLLLIVFITTNPNTIGPVGILSSLLLTYLLFFTVILHFRNKAAGKFTTNNHKKLIIFRSALDATPLIILVGLNTLRQVTIEDLLIVPVLYLAFKFYAHRQLGL